MTTKDAAEHLNISVRRVQALIKAGRLTAVKVGRDWMINKHDLASVEIRPQGYPKGKPRKNK